MRIFLSVYELMTAFTAAAPNSALRALKRTDTMSVFGTTLTLTAR